VRVLGRSLHFNLASPRLALDARGDALVAWRGFRKVAGGAVIEAVSTAFRPAGGRFGGEQKIRDGGPYQDVELDGEGNAYAVWTTYGGPVSRFAYSARGRQWGAPRTFTAPMASNPTLAVAPDRSVIVAWRAASVDSEGEGIQYGSVYACVRSPSGVFSSPVKLSEARVHDVGLAVSPTGEALFTWGAPDLLDSPVPGATDLRYALGTSAGVFGSEQRIPGLRAGPTAFLSDGTAVLAFGAAGNAIQATRSRPRRSHRVDRRSGLRRRSPREGSTRRSAPRARARP
jgi:hypothetical protein